jgi:hypothetical protein
VAGDAWSTSPSWKVVVADPLALPVHTAFDPKLQQAAISAVEKVLG